MKTNANFRRTGLALVVVRCSLFRMGPALPAPRKPLSRRSKNVDELLTKCPITVPCVTLILAFWTSN